MKKDIERVVVVGTVMDNPYKSISTYCYSFWIKSETIRFKGARALVNIHYITTEGLDRKVQELVALCIRKGNRVRVIGEAWKNDAGFITAKEVKLI